MDINIRILEQEAAARPCPVTWDALDRALVRAGLVIPGETRPFNPEEIRALSHNTVIYHGWARQGRDHQEALRVRISGAPKVWKRSGDWYIPFKCGWNEHGRIGTKGFTTDLPLYWYRSNAAALKAPMSGDYLWRGDTLQPAWHWVHHGPSALLAR